MPPKQYKPKRQYRPKTYKYKQYKKTTMRKGAKLVKLIKAVNLKQAETKYLTRSHTVNNLFHDTLADFQMWDSAGSANIFPAQGTTDADRIGDRIMCQGIRLRMALQIPWDRRNINVKMWFVPFNSSQGTPTTYSDFFHNVMGNSQLDPIQSKRWPGVMYLGNFYLKSKDRDISAQHTDATILINKWISMKKAVYFKADASNTPVNLREYGRIVIAPYDTVNTAVTDIVITKLEATTTLYFKDL